MRVYPNSSTGLTLQVLPGPDRKRTPQPYRYRIIYRSPEPDSAGCLMTWSVEGGQIDYQVTLERLPEGGTAWHCTCADQVYRSDGDPKHQCKHIKGLKLCLPPMG